MNSMNSKLKRKMKKNQDIKGLDHKEAAKMNE